MLEALSALLEVAPKLVKAFVPQLQATFAKALRDPALEVRRNGVTALGLVGAAVDAARRFGHRPVVRRDGGRRARRRRRGVFEGPRSSSGTRRARSRHRTRVATRRATRPRRSRGTRTPRCPRRRPHCRSVGVNWSYGKPWLRHLPNDERRGGMMKKIISLLTTLDSQIHRRDGARRNRLTQNGFFQPQAGSLKAGSRSRRARGGPGRLICFKSTPSSSLPHRFAPALLNHSRQPSPIDFPWSSRSIMTTRTTAGGRMSSGILGKTGRPCGRTPGRCSRSRLAPGQDGPADLHVLT